MTLTRGQNGLTAITSTDPDPSNVPLDKLAQGLYYFAQNVVL